MIETIAVARLRDTLPNARALPFLESLWLASRSVTVTQELARGTCTRTLGSRFHRANLPSAKQYLAATRLVKLRALLDDPTIGLTAASDTMRYSSVQALHRHVRLMTHQTLTEWRLDSTTLGELDAWFAGLITPYAATLFWFDPWAAPQLSERAA